jgi:hypothetical protein
MHPIGKPMPNKRGRKPLTKMPLAVSNLKIDCLKHLIHFKKCPKKKNIKNKKM